MFPINSSLTPREKMRLAKLAIIQAEKEEAELRKYQYPSIRRRISYEPSIHESVEEDEISSREPISVYPCSLALTCPSSPAPSLPLPPLPRPSSMASDFSPSPFASQASHRDRRRSARVRVPESDQGHGSPNVVMPSLGRSSSTRALRRESSIDGLRHDLASASRSLRASSKRSSTSSTISTASSDPSGWSKSSHDANHGAGWLQEDPNVAFKPQALPYPQIKPALFRLSIDVASLSKDHSTQALGLLNDAASNTHNIPHRPPHSVNARLSVASIPESLCSLSYTPSESSCTSTSLQTDVESPLNFFGSVLSPKSYPSPYAALRPRRRSSLATHVIHAALDDGADADDEECVKAPGVDRGVWLKVETSPRSSTLPMECEMVEVMLSDSAVPPGKHQRSDSTLSAIMGFPLPPDRVESMDADTPIEVVFQDLPAAMVEPKAGQEVCVAKEKSIVVIMDKEEGEQMAVRCPPSPELPTLVRTRLGKRQSASFSELGEESEESDLELSTPLVEAALHSKILSPSSRLLSTPRSTRSTPTPGNKRRAALQRSIPSLRSGMSFTSGKGWSGSESEEEDWVERSVKVRKSKKPSPRPSSKTSDPSDTSLGFEIGVDVDTTPKSSRFFPSCTPTLSIPSTKRFSSTSCTTSATISDAEGPLTPELGFGLPSLSPAIISAMSRSSSCSSTGPGDFPWGASSPPTSPQRQTFLDRAKSQSSIRSESSLSTLSSLSIPSLNRRGSNLSSMSRRENLRFSSKVLPQPLRLVGGWGRPEVLLDDETWGEDDVEISPSSTASFETVLDSRHAFEDDVVAMIVPGKMPRKPRMGSIDRTPRPGQMSDDTPRAGTAGRVPSPDLWVEMGQKVGRLMDEDLEDVGDGDW